MKWLLSLSILWLVGCSEPQLVTIHGSTMGTTYSVKAVGPDIDKAKLQAKIEVALSRVNKAMSTYLPDSEISAFNQSPENVWFPISQDFMNVMLAAQNIYELSHGSFDVTVGPLVNLWGFGPDKALDEVPDAGLLEAAMSQVGMSYLNIGPDGLMKKRRMKIDLSAIAKGYGVDQLADIMESEQIASYLVEIGGELRARGRNPQGNLWQIAIELPDSHQRMPYKVIALENQAMATSGDYRNYFEQDGVRYSHTIDPATGRPITHNLASVTVLAPTTTEADGLATAINVMGAERGLALAEQQDWAVFVILKTGDTFTAEYSTAFERNIHP